jgi:hypothetical protein
MPIVHADDPKGSEVFVHVSERGGAVMMAVTEEVPGPDPARPRDALVSLSAGQARALARELVATADEVTRPRIRAGAAEWLTLHLHRVGPAKAGTLIDTAERYGFTPRQIRRAAEDMAVVKDPAIGGRNATWQLPSEVAQAVSGRAVPGGTEGDGRPPKSC